MKKLTLLVIAVAGVNALVAQSTIQKQSNSTFIPCSGFYETIPLRDMPAQTDEQRAQAALHHDQLEEAREARRPSFPNFKKQAEQADPALQSADGIKALSAPLVNFDGQLTNGSCPPDPCGAVGLTQYVQ